MMMSAIVPNPSAAVIRWVSGKANSDPRNPLSTSPRGTLRPSSGSICRRTISTAAPVEKPTMTEWETKLTMKPRRNSPSPNWNTPTIIVSKPAATM